MCRPIPESIHCFLRLSLSLSVVTALALANGAVMSAAAQEVGSADDLGVMSISLADVVKPTIGFQGAPVYHACKHAVRSLGESLNMSEAEHNVRVINLAPGLIRTAIHQKMGISFEEYCEMLGNPTFIQPEELAKIVLFCWQLPQHICIRDLAVMPTDCGF